MRMRVTTIFLAMSSLIALVASSQTVQPGIPIEIIEGLPPGVSLDGIEIIGGPPGAVPVAGDAAAQPNPRLEKLKKLEFDRRPSTIMKTWSTPPKPEPEKPEILIEEEKRLAAEKEKAGDAEAPVGAETGEDEVSPSEEDTEVVKEEAGKEDEASTEEQADATGDENTDTESSADAGETTESEPPTVEGNPGTSSEGTAEGGDQTAPPVDPEEAARLAAEAQAKQKEAEAEAKRVAEVQAAKTKYENDLLDWELANFQRDVTLGEWTRVESYLAGLEENEQKEAYKRLLASLVSGPARKPQVPSQGRAYLEKNVFGPDDIIGLADACPFELEKEQLTPLSRLFRLCLDGGNLLESFLPDFHEGMKDKDFPLSERQMATILVNAGEQIAAGDFLPSIDEGEEKDDREALNLLARHHLARYGKEKKTSDLEDAWRATQCVLASGEVKEEWKEEALKRAVDIAPKIREELGQAWLDESFTKRPERGMEILATIGSSTSVALQSQPSNADARNKWLDLQTTAANALLDAAPDRAVEWKEPLNLMAKNWLREAEYTYANDQSTSRGPRVQRDVYGNVFYYDWDYDNNYRYRGNRPMPIASGKILEAQPNDSWKALIEEPLKPKFSKVLAQLYLKVGEETEAFPFIEALAREHAGPAKELVDEFLRVWARNHNPNNNNNQNNPYIYVFGFEQRANGIPLTRSKQERNLVELSEWVARLRELPVEMDVQLLSKAFTAAHSSAEVYRVETIESVFGSVDNLEPEVLASLAQGMRAALANMWRNPNVQKDAKTKRKKKDIEREVIRGYDVAAEVIEKALAEHPDNWPLHLADASVRHDKNNYLKDINKKDDKSAFSANRRRAFEGFRKAAELYTAEVSELKEDKESILPFTTWFYAALGACDIGAIDHEHVLAQSELPAIREALENLPKDRRERHLGNFANSLFTRMGSANPAVKFRYVRSGLEIVGDHERAREAKEVYEYYRDLVTEIQLDVRVDGSDTVGHDEPFGVFIDIRHTREIERESGGFGKYLVNQNNQGFSFNYGRPTENYRDKFDESAREALKEQFEIFSITFNQPKTNSRATEDDGWRVTPYAYALIKPRGPEVDKIPTLRLDMDFLDTSGYAVIPVESSAVPLDASTSEGEPRPFENLTLTQTLDERQAKDGKLMLEIKAAANGLIPDMDALVNLAPEGFTVDNVDDNGVSVVKFDEESDDPSVLSERLWNVTMVAAEGLTELPKSFEFASPIIDVEKSEMMRYVDADLESVEAKIDLEYEYGETVSPWPTRIAIGGGIVLLLGLLGFLASRKSSTAVAERRFNLPENVTPFTVIGLLRDIERNNGLATPEKQKLSEQIHNLERHYFVDEDGGEPNLKEIAESWVQRTS